MSRAVKLNKRFPKVLADRLSFALHAVRDLGHEKMLELLAIHRRNHVKRIATWGILNTGAPVEGLESIPLEHIHNIDRLDQAFQEIHNYMDGGADDYVAADVVSAISRMHAQEPRETKNDYGEICDWLNKRGYATSDNKKALVLVAMGVFEISESTVRKALRAGGLARKKQTAAT
jgi:hypothetical protein